VIAGKGRVGRGGIERDEAEWNPSCLYVRERERQPPRANHGLPRSGPPAAVPVARAARGVDPRANIGQRDGPRKVRPSGSRPPAKFLGRGRGWSGGGFKRSLGDLILACRRWPGREPSLFRRRDAVLHGACPACGRARSLHSGNRSRWRAFPGMKREETCTFGTGTEVLKGVKVRLERQTTVESGP